MFSWEWGWLMDTPCFVSLHDPLGEHAPGKASRNHVDVTRLRWRRKPRVVVEVFRYLILLKYAMIRLDSISQQLIHTLIVHDCPGRVAPRKKMKLLLESWLRSMMLPNPSRGDPSRAYLNVRAALGDISTACVVIMPPVAPSIPKLIAPAPANTSNALSLCFCTSSANSTASVTRA